MKRTCMLLNKVIGRDISVNHKWFLLTKILTVLGFKEIITSVQRVFK